MKKFRKAQCPYCGRKVSLLNSWFLKTQGEYKCPKCGGISNVKMDGAAYLFAALAVVLSGVFFTFYILFIKMFSWTFLVLVLVPFFLFYLISVFLVRLRKPVMKKKPPEGEKNPQSLRPPRQSEIKKETNNIERTIVMSCLKKM
jgi:CXXC-20-CXXC protein